MLTLGVVAYPGDTMRCLSLDKLCIKLINAYVSRCLRRLEYIVVVARNRLDSTNVPVPPGVWSTPRLRRPSLCSSIKKSRHTLSKLVSHVEIPSQLIGKLDCPLTQLQNRVCLLHLRLHRRRELVTLLEGTPHNLPILNSCRYGSSFIVHTRRRQ